MSIIDNFKESKDLVFQFAKEHPWVTQIALSTLFLGVKKVVRTISKITPSNCILELDFDTITITPSVPNKLDELFCPGTIYYRDLVNVIEKAATDNKVKAIICRTSQKNLLPLTVIQEIRDALLVFKNTGKYSVCFTETFGEFAPCLSQYYLASAFNEIYIPQCASLMVTSLGVDPFFLKDTLTKLGVGFEAMTRKEYKSALSILTNDKLSDPEREVLVSILNDLYDQYCEAIAQGRNKSLEDIKSLFASGPYNSDKALELKLVDGLLYFDQVYEKVQEKIKQEFKSYNLLYINKYIDNATKPYSSRNKNHFALINVEGAIHRGVGKNSFNGGPTIGSESLALAIRAASIDKHVKAIIISVNSPGGSYVASDLVHHEIEVAKKKGKKVVVSMGPLAASGGYYIACNADRIIASKATLTGSIGVLVGKMDVSEMFKKIGVTYDNVKINAKEGDQDNSSFFSQVHPYNDKQKEFVNSMLDYIYADFTGKVAQGRRLSNEKVEEVARGRVWTGKQALENGLVDKIGGLNVAIEEAKILCDIPKEKTPYVVEYPKESLLQKLLSTATPKNSTERNKKGTASVSSSASTSMLGNFIYTMKSIGILVSLFGHNSITNNAKFINLVNSMALNHGEVSLDLNNHFNCTN